MADKEVESGTSGDKTPFDTSSLPPIENTEENKAGVDKLKSAIFEKADHIVHKVWPHKILEIDLLYRAHPAFSVSELKNVVRRSGMEGVPARAEEHAARKKRKVEGGDVVADEDKWIDMPDLPVNKTITDMLAILKSEYLELIDMLGNCKMWIQLNIPRIEDGNNFGVSIQEETVGELGRAEDNAFAVLESMTKYYVTRAKLVTKVLKYPRCHDYIQGIMELDEKEFVNLRLCCLDLRNNYAILYDMITKNLEKIRKPRSNHAVSMF